VKILPEVDSLLAQAVALHQQGKLAEAAAIYRKVIVWVPQQFDALHLLGSVKFQQGQTASACCLLDAALEVKPDSAVVLAMRGHCLLKMGRFSEALASYDRVLVSNPDIADVLSNRGNILHELRRYEEALANYDRALVLKPSSSQTWNNRGTCLQKLHRPVDALASYERALAIQPDYVPALHHLAKSLLMLRRFLGAVVTYDRLLLLRPDDFVAMVNRGHALQLLRRFSEALANYDRALSLRPDDVLALVARGNVLRQLNRPGEAIGSFDQALLLKPDHAKALSERGDVLCALGRYAEAAEDYARLLGVAPDYPLALGSLFDARAQCCEWRYFEGDIDAILNGVVVDQLCALPFLLLVVSDSASAQLACAKNYATACYPAVLTTERMSTESPREKIRVAYLSGDFRQHAVAYLMAGVFEKHDRTRFEIFAVSFQPADSSAFGQRVSQAFDQFIDVYDMNDLEVAQLLRDLEIDIAVDLMGFTGFNRTSILASHPVPVQVSYLGFPGTMGAPYIDYLLADRYTIPEESRESYIEQVVYLPDCFQANDALREISELTVTRNASGLPEHGFVFCSFNNSYKITPQMFDVWMRLLTNVEGSVLWLLWDREEVACNLRLEAASRGVAQDRLVFAPRVPYSDHLARYRLADLFLDTLPYNAGTTASDALWAGLPLLTCSGESYAARMAGSLLHAVGLPELVTTSLRDYESMALNLATDADLLASIRAKLAHNRLTYPLFDTVRFTHHLEAAFLMMWQRQQRGDPATSFSIATQNSIQ
jgi:protein O-GlcNAc transferase